MGKVLIPFLVLFLILPISIQLHALEAGGEYGIFLTGIWNGGTFDSEVHESLDLELFLPEIWGNEVNYAFRIDNPLQDMLGEKEASYFAKKLYLRHRFENFNLTIGRQPVSWPFGSLLTPVDYTLGATAMEEESRSRYTDALELYIPLNWNSGLSMVLSWPDGFSTDSRAMKYGLRGRMGVKGYDLTLNYVQEAEESWNPLLPGRRAAFTLKGDFGKAGVYASYGHYFDDLVESTDSYLLGLDYSYNPDYFTKVSLQLEYLRLDNSNLAILAGREYMMMNSGGKRLELLSGSFHYPIDDFSSFSLIAMANLDGSRGAVSPVYQNTLPGNIDLTISGQIFLVENHDTIKALTAGMSYHF
ncbi:MAG: porin [Halanaerobiaceae bacterium]|jgi:hypothetical protein|nr:porin [Halanaerobiaceae bacterium]